VTDTHTRKLHQGLESYDNSSVDTHELPEWHKWMRTTRDRNVSKAKEHINTRQDCTLGEEVDQEEKHTNTPNPDQKNNNIGGTICAFWLKGNCRNGANCKFLHEKIPGKYPECPHGINCTRINNGCPYKHSKILQKECHAYNLGYCPNGKNCKDLHVEKELCINYLPYSTLSRPQRVEPPF